jgi:hypothetical protein
VSAGFHALRDDAVHARIDSTPRVVGARHGQHREGARRVRLLDIRVNRLETRFGGSGSTQ